MILGRSFLCTILCTSQCIYSATASSIEKEKTEILNNIISEIQAAKSDITTHWSLNVQTGSCLKLFGATNSMEFIVSNFLNKQTAFQNRLKQLAPPWTDTVKGYWYRISGQKITADYIDYKRAYGGAIDTYNEFLSAFDTLKKRYFKVQISDLNVPGSNSTSSEFSAILRNAKIKANITSNVDVHHVILSYADVVKLIAYIKKIPTPWEIIVAFKDAAEICTVKRSFMREHPIATATTAVCAASILGYCIWRTHKVKGSL